MNTADDVRAAVTELDAARQALAAARDALRQAEHREQQATTHLRVTTENFLAAAIESKYAARMLCLLLSEPR